MVIGILHLSVLSRDKNFIVVTATLYWPYSKEKICEKRQDLLLIVQ